MAVEPERQAKSLFVEALELGPAERATFLAARCGGDPSLTRRVERLLEAHERAGEFLADSPEREAGSTDVDGEAMGRGTLWRALGQALAVPAVLAQGDELTAYRIVSKLGEGGMGTVYVAELVRPVGKLETGQRVALKVVHSHLLETDGFFKRFLREAHVGQELDHVNVVRTFDCDAVARGGRQHHFLVMEYVEGQTLHELLQELHRVPEELCRHVGREVAKGLAAIHRLGAVHRDIKPENVLITPEHVVKVMDLGVARLQDEATRLSRAGGFVGSIEYAAPEQLDQSADEADGRADLYALGVVLYELATGQHPYRGDDARTVVRRVLKEKPRRAGDVNPQLSPFFEEVVHALIQKDRAQRFTSADELVGILRDGERGAWWKGRAQGLRIQTKQPLRRIRIPRETALCGRDEEVTKLRELFDAAKAGDGRVALIEGEAGIGKTRLVDEFVVRLRQEGEDINFLYGSYPPGGAATSIGAFSEAFREHFGQSGSSSYLQNAPLLAPSFDALLRSEPQPEDALELTAESLGTCFAHAVRNIAAERPTVLLIDDLHFASEESRSLFVQLASAVAGHRVLLVGTMRPGVPDAWIANLSRMEQTTQVSLGRLGPKDLTQLLVDAFQSERLAEELGFRIAHKSDGNPYFAFEIIRGLREGQFISQRPDGTWFRTSVIKDVEVPSSVRDLIQARLQDLSEEERELLDVASCVGFSFDPELVGRVVGVAMVPALRSFGRIENRHRLVRSAGIDLVFDHHQVQESLYEGLLERLRTRYHAAIAEALEAQKAVRERGGEIDGALCVELCGHFLKGSRGEQALGYFDAAMEHLGKNFRSDEAITLADCALAEPGLLADEARLEVLLQKNDRLDLLGRRAAQEEALTEARTLAQAAGSASLSRVERAAGELHSRVGRHTIAQEHFERCIALARDVGDRTVEAESIGSLGAVTLYQGRYADAQALFEQHLAIAREIGHERGAVRAELNLANALIRLGNYDKARESLDRLLTRAQDAGDRQVEVHVLLNASLVLSLEGRYAEARVPIERCLDVSRAIGYVRGEVVATNRLANILLQLGAYEEARAYIEQRLRLAEESGDLQSVSFAVGNLANLCATQGRFEEAEQNFERQLALSHEVGNRPSEVRALSGLSGVQLSQGRYEAARGTLERTLAIVREIGDRGEEATALVVLGRLAEHEGDFDAAQRHHEQALLLRRDLADAHVTTPLIGLARVALQRGDDAVALAYVDEALAAALENEQSGAILLATMLRSRLHEGGVKSALAALEEHEERADHLTKLEVRHGLWELTGDDGHLEAAHELLEFAVAHTAREHRRTMVENVPLHAEITAAWEQRSR